MSFDVRAIRREFPILAQPIGGRPLHYLDNAATGQAPRTMIEAIVAFETLRRANVLRGVHHLAEAATEAYADARAAVARYINAAPQDLVFTSGTTASINLVAHAFGDGLAAGDEVVISVAEHHSNIVPWQMLRQRRGIVLKALPVDDDDPSRVHLLAVEHAVRLEDEGIGGLRPRGAPAGERPGEHGAERTCERDPRPSHRASAISAAYRSSASPTVSMASSGPTNSSTRTAFCSSFL